MSSAGHLRAHFYVLRVGRPPARVTAHRVEERHLPPDEAADRPETGEVAAPIVVPMSK